MEIHSIDGMGYNALYGNPVVHAAKLCVGHLRFEMKIFAILV